MANSQDTSTTKRSVSPGADGNDKKQKVRKVVVKPSESDGGRGENGDGLKQQTLGAEENDKGERAKKEEKEEQEVIVIDDDEGDQGKDQKDEREGGDEKKKSRKATGDKEKEKDKFASREEAGKDKGQNFEPGQEPDLDLSKDDLKRKHGLLEKGHVYFIYRPKVETNDPHSLDDVSKFHLLLVPHESKLHRLLAIGKKALPDHSQSSRPIWGEVLNVGEDMSSLKKSLASYTYETKTMGTRHQPGSRVAASGAYVLHATENPPKGSENAQAVWNTHFAYQVALPNEMGEVQEALHIHPEGVFQLQVKDPESPSNNPAAPTQDPSKHPQYPEELSSLFKTKFIPADPPSLLDYPGAELLLIPSKHDVKEDIGQDAGKVLEKEEEGLEGDIEGEKGGDEVEKALKEMGLEGLIEGKALEGHWE